jgi:hypothetical protein
MNNLTYNPNIDIPSYYPQNAMEYPTDGGNFRTNDNRTHMPSMDPRMAPHMAPQMDPRMAPQMAPQMGHSMPNIQQSYLPQQDYRMNYQQPYNIEETMADKMETLDNNNKFNWILFLKKIGIYTLLFLIMSHMKMNNLLCRFIPFIQDSEVACMILKGFIMAVLIILIQKILK